jgi:hypothetical protein
VHRAEQPMTFRESLPPETRTWDWRVRSVVTLTLPADDGSHTAFTIHVAPRERYVAHNVALFPGWRTAG